MAINEAVLKGTATDWKLSVELRRPHSGNYCCLVGKVIAASGVERLAALQLCSTPVSQDVLAEFESDLMCTLEDAIAGLVGVQPLLGLQ